jgi:hypothetical protein
MVEWKEVLHVNRPLVHLAEASCRQRKTNNSATCEESWEKYVLRSEAEEAVEDANVEGAKYGIAAERDRIKAIVREGVERSNKEAQEYSLHGRDQKSLILDGVRLGWREAEDAILRRIEEK